MRNSEEDYELSLNAGIRSIRLKDCRTDSHATVTHDPNRDSDIKHQARVAAHTKRVQSEMQALGK